MPGMYAAQVAGEEDRVGVGSRGELDGCREREIVGNRIGALLVLLSVPHLAQSIEATFA